MVMIMLPGTPARHGPGPTGVLFTSTESVPMIDLFLYIEVSQPVRPSHGLGHAPWTIRALAARWRHVVRTSVNATSTCRGVGERSLLLGMPRIGPSSLPGGAGMLFEAVRGLAAPL